MWNTLYRFNGKELDPETGNQYYGARYYDPKVSIWLSVDPLVGNNPNLTPYNFVSNNPILRIEPDGMDDGWYKDENDNVVFDADVNSQEDLDKKGAEGEYLFEEGSVGGYDENDDLSGKYDLNSDGSINIGDETVAGTGFEELDIGAFSIFGSEQASENGSESSDFSATGPVLLAAGQPIKSLKPIGAMGSKPGSSIASYGLSKILPQKMPWRLFGTRGLGRAFGRAVPIFGQALLIYDAIKSDRMFDPALQGPRDMNKDIKNGNLNTEQLKKKYSCFVKGTKVQMSNGSKKNIEDIAIGDEILSVNIENMTIEVDTVIDIPNIMQSYKEVKAVFSNGIVNSFSPAHPFWVKGKGWCVFDVQEAKTELEFSVRKLEQGDTTLYYNGVDLIEVCINKIGFTGRVLEMYNVEYVKKNHSFFANGILVHNKRIN